MRQQPFVEKLRELKGKSFLVSGKRYVLSTFVINEHLRRVTLHTDKLSMDKTFAEMPEFLQSVECIRDTVGDVIPETVGDFIRNTVGGTPVIEAEAEEMPPNSGVENKQENGLMKTDDVYQEHSGLVKDMIAVLRENITKVQKDKGYIPQAQAVNNNVNSITNLLKLRLDAFKEFNGRKTG